MVTQINNLSQLRLILFWPVIIQNHLLYWAWELGVKQAALILLKLGHMEIWDRQQSTDHSLVELQETPH